MKSLHKKVLIMIASVLVLGIIAALPGFAETQDELKSIFVTRDELNKWIKSATVGSHTEKSWATDASGHTTTPTTFIVVYETSMGISEKLAKLEYNMQETVQSIVKIEMSRRDIKESSTTVASS